MTTTTERRSVQYKSLEEALADAEQRAAQQSPTTGQWSLGQIFEHLARTVDKSIDGFETKSPIHIRIVAWLFLKKRLLRDGLPSGYQLKGKSADEMVPGETSTEDGLEHLRRAVARYSTETKRSPHPAFGALTAEEWETLHLHHFALHMSFVAN